MKSWRQLTNDIVATYTSFCKFHMCKGTLVYKFLLKSSLEGVVLDYKNPLRIIQKLLLSLLSYLRYLAKQTFKTPRYFSQSQQKIFQVYLCCLMHFVHYSRQASEYQVSLLPLFTTWFSIWCVTSVYLQSPFPTRSYYVAAATEGIWACCWASKQVGKGNWHSVQILIGNRCCQGHLDLSNTGEQRTDQLTHFTSNRVTCKSSTFGFIPLSRLYNNL